MTPEKEAAIRARDAAVRFVMPDDVPSDAEMHGGIAALDRRTLLGEVDQLRIALNDAHRERDEARDRALREAHAEMDEGTADILRQWSGM